MDRERCQAAGMCALSVPEVFDQSEGDGRVVVLDPEPPPDLDDAVVHAALLCPNGVIRLVGADGPDGSSADPMGEATLRELDSQAGDQGPWRARLTRALSRSGARDAVGVALPAGTLETRWRRTRHAV